MTKCSYIKPITLGPVKLHSNVVQGPLAGYSCAPFRYLAWQYGKPGFCTTEMISANDLIHRKSQTNRYLYRDPEEGPLCFQLSGNDINKLTRATEIVTEAGADIIDLNCGCPVNKIRSKNCGSKLLADTEHLFHLIKAIKQNTDAAVSIKIRVASPMHDHDDALVIEAAEAAGVDFITVHGRHWTERYDVPCQMNAIANIVKMTKTPVFANGDVADEQSLLKLFETTHCAGVMIARAGIGQPWLYQKLHAAFNQQPYLEPNLSQIGNIFMQHIQRLVELENDKLAILQTRKLAKYYGRTVANREQFIEIFQSVVTLEQIYELIKKYFD